MTTTSLLQSYKMRDASEDIQRLRALATRLRSLATRESIIGSQLRQIAHETDAHADTLAVRRAWAGRGR